MYLNAKKLAFLGLLLAFDVVLIILSGILEFNTLFLLAAASFCVGIAIRESSKQFGFGFFLASILLGLILAPNKFHCITYAAMGLYLVVVEYAFDQLAKIKGNSNSRRKSLFWLIKYLTFNVMYLPILFLLPKLIYQGNLNIKLLAVFILAGQVALFIYDKAYEYFQRSVWGKMRGYLKL
ncbi:MAG TPA: hypothetical protein VN258_19535 [Mobilitalea sp.]|nr:hypothetical protein [Mobilitalea sp.]